MEKKYFIEIQMDGKIYTSNQFSDLKNIYEVAEKAAAHLHDSKEAKVSILTRIGPSEARVDVNLVPQAKMLSFRRSDVEALEFLIESAFKRQV